MNHTYSLLNPLDYARVLFLAFFNHDGLAEPEERRQRVILKVQGVLIVLVVNALVGWLAVRAGDWEFFAFGIVASVIVGVIFCLAGAVAFGVAFGVAVGVAVGVVGSVIGSAALGVALGVAICVPLAFGAGIDNIGVPNDMVTWTIVVTALSVSSGAAAGVKELLGGTWGWGAGLGIATVGSLIAIAVGILLALAIYLIWDVTLAPGSSIVADWWSAVALLILLSLGTGYLFVLLALWVPALRGPHPLWIAAVFFLIQSRLPVWPLEMAVGLCSCAAGLRPKGDPANLLRSIRNCYFDRYTWLPLPGEGLALHRLAALDWNKGIEGAVVIARTSNHLLTAVKALRVFAQTDPYSIQAYSGASGDLLDYTFNNQGEAVTLARTAYETLRRLGERLAPEQPASELETEPHRQPLLAQMRELLEKTPEEEGALTVGDVLAELSQAVEAMQLSKRLAGEDGIRYAEEMIALYAGLKAALGWTQIPQIAAFETPVLPADDAPYLFSPILVEALIGLDEIAQTVAVFDEATSQVTKQRSLLSANAQLVSLGEQVEEQIQTFQTLLQPPRALPASVLLVLVITRWQRLLAAGGGELARAESVGPVANPYVIGNPVTGDLFVGRQDILRRLEELWSGTGQKPSVVIYGHRRMGKSSILHNLGARFGPHTVIVDFNMQRVGLVASTGELLYNLALALYDAQTLGVWETPRVLDEPDEERFTAHNPYTAFDRFLKRLDQVRAGRRFIVTVDEFELIEKAIPEEPSEPRLLDFWRGLIHTYPWFVMAFAGLHTLEEMRRDFWNPLYGSVTAIPVSFLSRDAAWRLITQPTPEFPLDYDADAVERIIALTHGQPYLVQLIGHGLVTRFNRQTFEEGLERERRFSLADVEAVIGAPVFFRDGDAYFTGVWRQAETSEPPGQIAVLRALACSEAGIPLEEIARQVGLAPEEVGRALQTLKRHDVVMEEDSRWQFTVELMRRWVEQR